MTRFRIVVVLACAVAAWGGATALLLPEAVRRARLLEANDSLRAAAVTLPWLVEAERVRVLELARSAAEQGVAAAVRTATGVDPAAAVRALVRWADDPGVQWTVLSEDGVVLARSANSAKHGDSLASEPVLRLTWTGRAGERLGFVDGAWRIAAAVPLRPLAGAPKRLLLATRPVDLSLATRLGDQLAASIVLAEERLVLASTLPAAAADPFRVLLGRDEVPSDGPPADLILGGEVWRCAPAQVGGLSAWALRRAPSSASGVGDALASVGLVGWERWARAGPVLLVLGCALLAALGLALRRRRAS